MFIKIDVPGATVRYPLTNNGLFLDGGDLVGQINRVYTSDGVDIPVDGQILSPDNFYVKTESATLHLRFPDQPVAVQALELAAAPDQDRHP